MRGGAKTPVTPSKVFSASIAEMEATVHMVLHQSASSLRGKSSILVLSDQLTLAEI